MKPNCTWTDPAPGGRCQWEAEQVQRDAEGQPWASLCRKHTKELDAASDISRTDWNAGTALRAWVRAGGGAAKMAKRLR